MEEVPVRGSAQPVARRGSGAGLTHARPQSRQRRTLDGAVLGPAGRQLPGGTRSGARAHRPERRRQVHGAEDPHAHPSAHARPPRRHGPHRLAHRGGRRISSRTSPAARTCSCRASSWACRGGRSCGGSTRSSSSPASRLHRHAGQALLAGMQTRLGFSIAAHLDPDVMVIDEALAVGDAAFQAKALRCEFRSWCSARSPWSWCRTSSTRSRRSARTRSCSIAAGWWRQARRGTASPRICGSGGRSSGSREGDGAVRIDGLQYRERRRRLGRAARRDARLRHPWTRLGGARERPPARANGAIWQHPVSRPAPITSDSTCHTPARSAWWWTCR